MMRCLFFAALAYGAAAAPPNFVYVLLDDMNTVLGDEQIITQTRSLIADRGARASNAFVSSPKCTPSRSAWLSGRFYHNIRPNGATSGRGLNTSNHFDYDALFPTLHRNGYQTGLFGKIHNNQAGWLCNDNNHTEPFTHIETECSPCGNYMPKEFVVKEHDKKHTKMEKLAADDPRTHYSHAQYGNRSAAWIRQVAPQGPFFCFVGTTGPHLPATPAPWHVDIAKNLNISAPRTPNFNQQCKDHNHLLATHDILGDEEVGHIDDLMRSRWGVLMSVDDLVAGLVEALEDAGVMDNTYFLFSSDHGYHLGQFRIPMEKMLPYETDIRVPFYIRGPGIRPGTQLTDMIANIDIAPTLVDLAGLPVPPIMDGLSMKNLLTGQQKDGWRTRFISEFAEGGTQTWHWASIYDEPQNQWRMLRVINDTHDIAYMEWDQKYVFDKVDFHEYYDLKADPWQQVNLWESIDAALQAALHAELVGLYVCRGTEGKEFSSCHTAAIEPMPTPDPPPTPTPTPQPKPTPTPSVPEKPERMMSKHDIHHKDTVSPCPAVSYTQPEQCQAECDAAGDSCDGWTFHYNAPKSRNPGWRCCQKSGFAIGDLKPIGNVNTTSGVRVPSALARMLPGLDLPGHDATSPCPAAASNKPADCQSRCNEDAACEAWTLHHNSDSHAKAPGWRCCTKTGVAWEILKVTDSSTTSGFKELTDSWSLLV